MFVFCATGWTEELPKAEGLDVIKAAKAIGEALKPNDPGSARGKPWAEDIAALTDPRTEVHTQAMASLIRRGEPVVPDLIILSTDQDWQLRQRVAAILATIGGDQANATIITMCDDKNLRVAEVAIIGLGKSRGPGSFDRLAQALKEKDPNERQAAAKGMGLHGDPAALALLCGYIFETDDLVRRDMRENLSRIANQARAVPTLIELLKSQSGPRLLALLEATASISDPRLSPTLATILFNKDPEAAALAARVLAANGDSRAVGSLCKITSSSNNTELREYAASTLRLLTGYQAAAGVAWDIWWRDHQGAIENLQKRDELIAALHDPNYQVTRDQLATIPAQELLMLLDGTLGKGAQWWPANAYKALQADAPNRWTGILFTRIEDTFDMRERVRLIILLDQLGDPQAVDGFRKLYERLETQPAVKAAALGPERVALRIALERRGVIVK